MHERECRFGEIESGKMVLNDAGKMVDYWWGKLRDKYPNIKLDEYSIMPNHFHGIINIGGSSQKSGGCARPSLQKTIQWFKTMSTNEYVRNIKANNWKPFSKRLWQRNYFEHIIRGERSLGKIREYIVKNPVNWQRDELFMILP